DGALATSGAGVGIRSGRFLRFLLGLSVRLSGPSDDHDLGVRCDGVAGFGDFGDQVLIGEVVAGGDNVGEAEFVELVLRFADRLVAEVVRDVQGCRVIGGGGSAG